MVTSEPSSDLIVEFTLVQPASLAAADQLKVGDAIAVLGRVQTINRRTRRIALAQTVFRYKDRPLPKLGKELLLEINPKARRGTDTSSGKEEVLR